MNLQFSVIAHGETTHMCVNIDYTHKDYMLLNINLPFSGIHTLISIFFFLKHLFTFFKGPLLTLRFIDLFPFYLLPCFDCNSLSF